MAQLTIRGRHDQLEIIRKQNGARAKKYGLTMTLQGESQASVMEKMKAATSLEELQKFSNDGRQKVKKLFNSLVKRFQGSGEGGEGGGSENPGSED